MDREIQINGLFLYSVAQWWNRGMTRKGFGNSMSKLETGMLIYDIDIHKYDTGIWEPYYEYSKIYIGMTVAPRKHMIWFRKNAYGNPRTSQVPEPNVTDTLRDSISLSNAVPYLHFIFSSCTRNSRVSILEFFFPSKDASFCSCFFCTLLIPFSY